MTRPDAETPTIPPHRLEALADGVFAIVMTLLVFQLGVPLATESGFASVGGEVESLHPAINTVTSARISRSLGTAEAPGTSWRGHCEAATPDWFV